VTVRISLPSVHMAGSNACYPAHFELGRHGLALFLTPDSELPVLDINASIEQLDTFVQSLQAALTSLRTSF
jgi:hypothetical protein